MKRKPFLLGIFVIWMMTITATTAVAQESTPMIYFIDEEGYTVDYDLTTLADIIATSDTMVADNEWLMEEYVSIFPSKRGAREPAVLVLIPTYDYFFAIVIQENKKGKLLSLRILTRDGWMEADEESLRISKNLF